MVICLLFSAMPNIFAHKEKQALIIDTDMALDDVRAISLIIGSGKFNVIGLIGTEGSASAETGSSNIEKMLCFFGMDGVPVLTGKDIETEPPKWRAIAEGIEIPQSGENAKPVKKTDPAEFAAVIRNTNGKVLYLCLGPMTNLAALLKADPAIGNKIERIIFYGSAPGASRKDFNYLFDPQAAEFVFSQNIPITLINIASAEQFALDENIFSEIEKTSTPAARLISAAHGSETAKALIKEKHFKLWDDFVALYLLKPALFKESAVKNKNIRVVDGFKSSVIIDAYLDLLKNSPAVVLDPREAVVLKEFPVRPSLFRDDVKPFVERIIKRHGLEEWKACFLTNELHRHLGGYSIIGAKMGIRAREILNAPFDELTVVSHAGSEPPLSCMNDGLQASTGASLGRGSITLANDKNEPSAEFQYKGRTVRMSVREEIVQRIKDDIKMTAEKYGWLTDAYYKNLRAVAIQYWLELDRNKIFIEQ